MNERKLRAIKAHGLKAEIRNGAVWGRMEWTKDGEWGYTWEKVGNVRDWLGY